MGFKTNKSLTDRRLDSCVHQGLIFVYDQIDPSADQTDPIGDAERKVGRILSVSFSIPYQFGQRHRSIVVPQATPCRDNH